MGCQLVAKGVDRLPLSTAFGVEFLPANPKLPFTQILLSHRRIQLGLASVQVGGPFLQSLDQIAGVQTEPIVVAGVVVGRPLKTPRRSGRIALIRPRVSRIDPLDEARIGPAWRNGAIVRRFQ